MSRSELSGGGRLLLFGTYNSRRARPLSHSELVGSGRFFHRATKNSRGRQLLRLVVTACVAIVCLINFGCIDIGNNSRGRVARDDNYENQYIHANFAIDADILFTLIANLPENIQANILRMPEYFLSLLHQALFELPAELMVRVDKQYGLAADFVPSPMVPLVDYEPVLSLSSPYHQLHISVIPDLLAMSVAAQNDGVELLISSTYRSYNHQHSIFERNLDQYGRVETEQSVAPPGHSQHQLGTAVDFGSITDDFEYTDAGQWALENSWKYGFSLSYPRGVQLQTGYKYESWHYRYIGRAACTLERHYFNGQQHELFDFLHAHRATLETLLST